MRSILFDLGLGFIPHRALCLPASFFLAICGVLEAPLGAAGSCLCVACQVDYQLFVRLFRILSEPQSLFLLGPSIHTPRQALAAAMREREL